MTTNAEVLIEKVFNKLEQIEFDFFVISDDQIKEVLSLLEINEGTTQERMLEIRNAFVKHTHLQLEERGVNGPFDKKMVMLSAVTAAIDSKMIIL